MGVITSFPGCTDCCPGVGESCCGCDGVPDTLIATVANISFCGCVDGVTVVMTFQGSCTWTGSAPINSKCNECAAFFDTLCLNMQCVLGVWRLTGTLINSGSPLASCSSGCGGFTGVVPISAVCSPFHVHYDNFTSFCDDGLGDDGEITIDVTP